jgi:hypothetical protein
MRPFLFSLRERAFLAKQRQRLGRLAPWHRPPADAAALLAAVRAKTLVVTVTAGRTGTTFLTHLLALCPDTTSRHEPEPSFVPVLRLAQRDPELARRFLLEYKLPFIADVPTRRYVETGHLLCKGFLEPLLALGVAPQVIALRPVAAAVATSLLSRRTVPGRGKLGLKYLLHPADPGCYRSAIGRDSPTTSSASGTRSRSSAASAPTARRSRRRAAVGGCDGRGAARRRPVPGRRRRAVPPSRRRRSRRAARRPRPHRRRHAQSECRSGRDRRSRGDGGRGCGRLSAIPELRAWVESRYQTQMDTDGHR